MDYWNLGLSVVTVIFSGVVAAYINIYYNNKHDEKKIKLAVVADVFGYRHLLNRDSREPQTIYLYSALNRIPIVFADNKKVIEHYNRLHELIYNHNCINREEANKTLVLLLKELSLAVDIDTKYWNDVQVLHVFGR